MEMEKMWSKVVLVFFVSLFLSGCAKHTRIQKTLEHHHVVKFESTRVQNYIVQNQLEPFNTAGMVGVHPVGGLFLGGAPTFLIVAAQKAEAEDALKKAREKVEPLQLAVKDVDFRSMVNEQLLPKLTAIGWLKIKKIAHLQQDAPLDQFKDELKNGSEDAVLTLYTTYLLSPKLTTLTISSVLKLWIKRERNPIYIGTFEYQSLPVVAEKDPEQAINKWMASNQAAYRFAIAQGMREIGAMIRYELDERSGVADFGKTLITVPYTSIIVADEERVELEAKLIRKSGSRYWVRANGIMVSVGKDGLLMGDSETSRAVWAQGPRANLDLTVH